MRKRFIGYKRVRKDKINVLGPIFKLIPTDIEREKAEYYSKLILVNKVTRQYAEIPAIGFHYPAELHLNINNKNYILASSEFYPENVEIKFEKYVYLIKHKKDYVCEPGAYFIDGKAVRLVRGSSRKIILAGIFADDTLVKLGNHYLGFNGICAVFRKNYELYGDYVGLESSTGDVEELQPIYRTEVRTARLSNNLVALPSVPDILIQDSNKICSRYLVFDMKYKNKLASPLFAKMLADRGCFLGPSFVLGERKDNLDGKDCVVRIMGDGFGTKATEVNDKLYVRMRDPFEPECIKYIEIISTGIKAENLKIIKHGRYVNFGITKG